MTEDEKKSKENKELLLTLVFLPIAILLALLIIMLNSNNPTL
jgi:hypothetical protein